MLLHLGLGYDLVIGHGIGGNDIPAKCGDSLKAGLWSKQ
jgi:hypothetical protein